MTKIESRDFALIFLGKRPFNTLSKMELTDIVIVTMDFYLHSAQEILSVMCTIANNGQTEFLPILQDFVPYRGRYPASIKITEKKKLRKTSRAGPGNR